MNFVRLVYTMACHATMHAHWAFSSSLAYDCYCGSIRRGLTKLQDMANAIVFVALLTHAPIDLCCSSYIMRLYTIDSGSGSINRI